MLVSWTVKQNLSGTYDVFRNGNIAQRRIPLENLEATLGPHHIRGQHWLNLLRQLEESGEGTVTIEYLAQRRSDL